MFINKIEIENFCGFDESTVLDLNYDPSICKLDLNMGYLKLIDNKILAPIVAISGGNGTGKSSLLEAIGLPTILLDNVPQHFITLENFTNTINRWITHISSDFNEEIQNVKNPFKDYKFANVQTISGFVRIMPDILNMIKLIHLYSNYDIDEFKNKLEILTNKLQEICNKATKDNTFALIKELNEFMLKEKYNFWQNLKRIKDKDAKVVFELYDTKYGEITFRIMDNNSISEAFYFEWSCTNPNVSQEELWRVLVKYFASSSSPYTYDLTSSRRKLRTEDEQVQDSLIELIQKLGYDQAKKLLRAVDNNIAKLEVPNYPADRYAKLIEFVNTDGSVTPIKFLSKGTKRFIILLSRILNKVFDTKSNDGFILVDELEAFLHASLTSLIKEIIYGLGKKVEIQLFFTSHNPIVLTGLLSAKQIFIINKYGSHSVIESAYLQVNDNDSILKSFIDQKIGSHPDVLNINKVLDNILLKYDSKK